MPLGVNDQHSARPPCYQKCPTIAEAGVTGFDYPNLVWGAVLQAPLRPEWFGQTSRRTSPGFTSAAPDMRDWLAKHGADPMSMTQAEFAQFVVSESENAARIVEAAGIKPR